tara:strand:- start:1866 stop:2264 length:399 start_codon:yes stop_codon:yes gene_type:complete
MGMRNGVEIRVPYLDRRIINFANSVPTKYKFNKNKTKTLLLNASKNNVRKTVWDRPKQGFVFPMEEWFRNELKYFGEERLLSDNMLLKLGFNQDEIKNLWNEFQTSNKRVSWSRAWSLIVLSQWCDVNNVSF